MHRSDLIARLRALFAERSAGVVCAHLSGSVARGEASAGSDVDLAALLAAQPPATLEDGLGLGLAGVIEAAKYKERVRRSDRSRPPREEARLRRGLLSMGI